jgi:hypothetical protein
MSTLSISPAFDYPRLADRRLPVHRSQVRLTRRGRLVVFLLALAFVLTAAIFLGTRSTATNESGTEIPTKLVMVGPGETLWSIASELAEDGEVRDMVDQIERLNALDDSMLYAGQELHVPVVD